MDGLLELIAGTILIAVLAGPCLAILALNRSHELGEELRSLKRDVARLTGASRYPSAPPEEAAPPVVEPAPAEPETAEPAPAAAWETPPAPPPGAPTQTIEEALTSRWLVWGGSVALAFGGFFLVKFSIEQGWLAPAIRVSLGVALGVLLVAAGEWPRRRPLERALAAIRPSYIPPALTAAGISILFTSIYAAHALYDLIPASSAFLLLAGVTACAVLLSLSQGPLIAAIGLVGGFLTPWLTSTGEHRPEVLFPYLLLLTAGLLAIVRYTAHWWLAWLALAGATLWPLLWFAAAWEAGDAYFVGPYLLAAGALFVLVRSRSAPDGPWRAPPRLLDMDGLSAPEPIATAAVILAGFLIFVLVRMDHYGGASLVFAGIGVAAMLATARREAEFDAFQIAAAVLVLAIVASWHLPEIIEKRAPIWVLDNRGIGKVAGPIVPPALTPFLVVSAVYALIVGGGAFAALWGARRPALWASVSAATPVLVLAVAYWRIKGFSLDLAWTASALVLCLVLLLAAERVQRYRDAPGMTGALGAYAVSVIAALSLAATTALENAWLTVALAIQLPAIAWIAARLELPAMRRVALTIAAIVLVRLILNHQILDYPIGRFPGLNWLIYGYGGPAVAFFIAARMFRRRSDDALVTLLEAGALAFAVLFVSLEIRHLMSGGPLDAPRYGFAERSIQSIVWLAVAYILYARQPEDGRPVPVWGWRILAGLAVAQTLGLQLAFDNPLLSDVPVGVWPLFNLLLLGYLVPAAFALMFLRDARRRGDERVARAAGLTEFVLGFAWLNFEIRHAFHGSLLSGATASAELYTYSLGWLAYAGTLLALALLGGGVALRYASLAIVLLTAAKAVFFDMAGLDDIWRALSFIGVGLAAVGVSYLYRRYVFPPRSAPAPP